MLTDHFELHLLELPKLRQALDRNDEPSLAAWGKFLSATADEDLETLAMEDPVLKQAKDALDRLSADPAARIRAEQREMALFSHELGLSRAHRDGIAEILQQQLTVKFGPLSAGVAERITSASHEELATWANRILSATTLENVFESERAKPRT